MWSDGPVTTKVVIGALDGAASPATAYTPLLGAEIAFAGPGRTEIPLDPDFEYAVLTLDGSVDVDGEPLPTGPLLYLGTSRDRLALAASAPARVLLLGGEPFAEEIIMWWNFIGRSHEEIVASRDDWMAGRRFGSGLVRGRSVARAGHANHRPQAPRSNSLMLFVHVGSGVGSDVTVTGLTSEPGAMSGYYGSRRNSMLETNRGMR